MKITAVYIIILILTQQLNSENLNNSVLDITWSLGYSAKDGLPIPSLPKISIDYYFYDYFGIYLFENYINSMGAFQSIGGGIQSKFNFPINVRLGYAYTTIGLSEIIYKWHNLYLEFPIALLYSINNSFSLTPGIIYIPDTTHYNFEAFPIFINNYSFSIALEYRFKWEFNEEK